MPANPPTALPHAQTRQSAGRLEQPEQTPLAALWRTREYLRPYYRQLALMLAAAIVRGGRRDRDPAADQGDHRWADRAQGRPRAAAARPGRDRARRASGRFKLLPAVGAGQRRHQPGTVHAGRPLRAPAAAACRVPRRLAVRPAAVPRDHRPRRDPALRRFRHDLLRHQRGDIRGRRRAADPAELVARAAHRRACSSRSWCCACGSSGGTGCCPAAPRTSRATSPPTSRRPRPASGCSRRSAAATRPRPRHARPGRARAGHADAEGQAARHVLGRARPACPNAVIGLILLLGALAVSRHELTSAAWSRSSRWPCSWSGRSRRWATSWPRGQEAATAAQRIYEIFDTDPPSPTAGGRAPALAAAQAEAPGDRAGTASLDHVDVQLPGRPHAGACAASAWS